MGGKSHVSKTEAFNFLDDKYEKSMDEEHLLLKYQLLPDERKDIEKKYFDKYVTSVDKSRGKDYALKVIRNKELMTGKKYEGVDIGDDAIRNTDIAIIKDGTRKKSEGFKNKKKYNNTQHGGNNDTIESASNQKYASQKDEIMTLFNIVFNLVRDNVFDVKYPPGSDNINQIPKKSINDFGVIPPQLSKYVLLMNSLYNKFDDQTKMDLQSVVDTYEKKRSRAEMDNLHQTLPSADEIANLEEYYNQRGEYLAKKANDLKVTYGANMEHKHHMHGLNKFCICDREKRKQLWKHISSAKEKDFDPAGYTIEELEAIYEKNRT